MNNFQIVFVNSDVCFDKSKGSEQNISHRSKIKLIKQIQEFENVEDLPSMHIYLLERRITCMTIPALVKAIYQACVDDTKITIAHYNINSFNLSMQLPWFYNFLQNAEITNCDSIGILKAISYMGLILPIEYRASYTLLMPAVFEKCNQHNLSVFVLGAKPENLEAALENLREQYPNVTFNGHHGYFDKDDRYQNQEVIEKINQVKPNILLVGMGMPIQEKWIYNFSNYLQVNVIMLGGAIIDRFAGIVPDCPSVFADTGFEWFYRLRREPKRLAARYLLGNPAFMLHIILAKMNDNKLIINEMKNIN